MIRSFLTTLRATSLGLALAGVAAPALADSPDTRPKAQVNITIGQGLTMEAPRYGEREYPYLSKDLEEAVAARAAAGGFVKLDLVLEYARPNHPTFNQMSLSPGLSLQSIGLGGATVTGFAERADGARIPLKFSWYETDLRQEIGSATWTDAERAFDQLGGELKRGRVPSRFGPGTLAPRKFFDRREVF